MLQFFGNKVVARNKVVAIKYCQKSVLFLPLLWQYCSFKNLAFLATSLYCGNTATILPQHFHYGKGCPGVSHIISYSVKNKLDEWQIVYTLIRCPHFLASDLDLHCLLMSVCPILRVYKLFSLKIVLSISHEIS